MAEITKDLGIATAYGYALSKGYTGTEEEFAQLLKDVADGAGNVEAWADGTINGEPVPEDAPQYHNNSKYYSEQSDASAQESSGYANDAKGYANDASGYANDASGYANDASEYANDASGHANTASGYADNASDSADAAALSASQAAAAASAAVGSPLVAATVADMTETTKIYVYVGSEAGYTAGDWYYWDGAAWTDGGIYNSAAVQTDTTLSVAGMAADAKAAGDAIGANSSDITDLKSATDDGITQVSKAITWQAGYVAANGQVKASTLSQYAVVDLAENEVVKIGTANGNVCIIGSTTAETVSVGDTITVIQTTAPGSAFENHEYTATEPIRLVLTVLASNYTLAFYSRLACLDSIYDKFNNLDLSLIDPAIDLLPLFAAFDTQTKNGLTYTFNKNTAVITGTTTAISFCALYENKSSLPWCIVPGEKYLFKEESTLLEAGTTKCDTQVSFYVSGDWVNYNVSKNATTEITVPSGAVGLRLRAWLTTVGADVNERYKLMVYRSDNIVSMLDKATKRNTYVSTFTPKAEASQGANIGDKIRISSYNVAHYNNDTATYLPDDKVFNFRKVLYKMNADIVCIQEDRETIDSGEAKDSTSYLFAPQYPNKYGTVETTIHSKMANANASYYLLFATGRRLTYSLFEIGAKKVLLVSAHPGLNVADRLSDYTQLFDWLNGDLGLFAVDNTGRKYVPEYTHAIVCMDANCSTAEDKTNLTALCNANDYVMVNGGAIGWFMTCVTSGVESAIDTIICSQNIIINNAEALNDWYEDLYSDHVPIYADLTLL